MGNTTIKDTIMEDTVMEDGATEATEVKDAADATPESYALVITKMQAEATKHIKGGELNATDPWEPREYIVGLSVARAWLHKADLGETGVEKVRRIKKEVEEKEQEVKAANEHLRLQFKSLKRLDSKKPAPETIDLTEN
ncbi:hypothetical protein DID88_003908 [Monilinia fructigena]|uniref:Uncharacterized protein n=1 Tax=Monilinia fructigena TaxID=38457 RepID=A0A395IV00_9HELO|nr:hypothetical protein DID88_003908 [Monilinia fructigena]